MFQIIEPFSAQQLATIRGYGAVLRDRIEQLTAEEKALNCLTGSAEEPDARLLAWESRNRRLQTYFFSHFDVSEIVKGGLLEHIERRLASSAMIFQLIYLRIATPCGVTQLFMPHRDNIPVPSLTVWIPFHDISERSGGICFPSNQWNSSTPYQTVRARKPSLTADMRQPFVRFGQCIVFDRDLLHAGSTAAADIRLSVDLRFASAENARRLNEELDEPFRINARQRYDALNFSSLDDFRAEQVEHLKRMQRLMGSVCT